MIEHCVMDGGITPYRLPWIITRIIAIKDYLMMMLGKIGGVGLLENLGHAGLALQRPELFVQMLVSGN